LEFEMTVAPQHPRTRAYEGENPYDLVDSRWGRIERWRANAMATGEASAATQARHDAVTTLDDIEAQKRVLAAGQAALAIDRATFDAERRKFADQAASLAGRLSVEWDRMEKLRADQEREPISHPPGFQGLGDDAIPGDPGHDPGDPSDPSKLPEPSLDARVPI
jgi:hypothetical protein